MDDIFYKRRFVFDPEFIQLFTCKHMRFSYDCYKYVLTHCFDVVILLITLY